MLRLDHVAFGTRDAAAMAEGAAQLGLMISAVGECSWRIGGRSFSAPAACVVFERQYLDFVEVSGARFEEHLRSSIVYRCGAAPTAIVLSGRPPAAVRSSLERAGREAPPAYPIERRFPGSTAPVATYEFLPLDPLGLPLGAIADSAPQALRRREWLAHPSSAVGISRVHLRVPSAAGAADHLATLGLAGATTDSGAVEVSLGGPVLVLHEQPRGRALESLSALLPKSERPALLAIELGVRSLESARESLRAKPVSFIEEDGMLCVDSADGLGVGIFYAEAR